MGLFVMMPGFGCKHCIECYTTVGGVQAFADEYCGTKSEMDTTKTSYEEDCQTLIASGSVDDCGCMDK